jgi:hypothetical protein
MDGRVERACRAFNIPLNQIIDGYGQTIRWKRLDKSPKAIRITIERSSSKGKKIKLPIED